MPSPLSPSQHIPQPVTLFLTPDFILTCQSVKVINSTIILHLCMFYTATRTIRIWRKNKTKQFLVSKVALSPPDEIINQGFQDG